MGNAGAETGVKLDSAKLTSVSTENFRSRQNIADELFGPAGEITLLIAN